MTDFRMNKSSCHYCVHSASHTTCCQLSYVLISLHNVLQAWAEVYDSPQAWHALHLCKCVCHRVNFLVPQPVQTLQQYPQAITLQKLQQPFPGKKSIKGKGNSLHNLLPWCDTIRRLHTFFTSALRDGQWSALRSTHFSPSLPSSSQTVHMLISSRLIMSFRNQRAAINQNTTNWPGDIYCTVLYCTVLYCTVLYCTVLYCIVLYFTVLYCTVLYCTVLYCTVLHCNTFYCTVLYCNVLYCTVLYCTVLYSIVLYCTVLHCIVLYCTVLYCIVLYCAELYCNVLYCTVLYCTVLHCTVLYSTVLLYCKVL